MGGSSTLTVLLIDDDADDRELFEIAVEELAMDLRYESFPDGPKAIESLRSGSVIPNVIFLDLNMPEMDGRECLAALKASESTSSIPVVIFSTSSDPKDIADTMQLGAVHFITKPVHLSDLSSSIADFITNHFQSATTS